MVTKTRDLFTTVTIEGALLPPDILQRVTDGDTDLGGLHPEAYHLYGERLNEATNRAWNRLQGAWQAFKGAQERLPDDDIGTTITRERWLLVLFNALDYGRLDSATAVELDGKSYAISHRYKDVPIHLLSYKVDLDSRTKGVVGAATGSPHSMMQVFLNRQDEHLWGFLSNGYRLRILRDNLSLTRQAYIEFDLQAMMEGEVYSDFVLLYLLCHQSRVEADNPNDYWLEKWRKAAEEQGKRALEDLRVGVESAINSLGMGFLDHPHNTALRDALSDGSLDKQDYYRQLLRLVYRMLFLFVAEDRDLLHKPDASDQQRKIYQHYSTNKLRDLAADLRGTRHHDLFESLRLVMRLLGGEREGAEGLGLPVLGSFLFSDAAIPHLIDARLPNSDLLAAVRAISTVEDREIRRLRRVDFKNLGSEELGSVYESLLELHPDINLTARTFALKTAGGNERKTTGSYYTPTALINALLDSALDPVLDEAISPHPLNPPLPHGEGDLQGQRRKLTRAEMEANILDLKVVDPACGSGHFLIAAANRMAKRLAQVRTGEDEPTPEFVTEAKRDVIANCIYGVDLNPMAVELCKVNLWLESIDPGKPLTFLDNRIRQGNSLMGTTPALMARGIPADAFPTKSGLIEGDQNKIVGKLRKQNRQELKDRASGQQSMFQYIDPPTDYTHLSRQFQQLVAAPDDTLSAVQAKEARFRALAQDPEYVKGKFLADLWCAVFVWMKAEGAVYSPHPLNPPLPTTRSSLGEGDSGNGNHELGERNKDGEYRTIASSVMRDIARDLRQRETPAEDILWEALRNRRLDNIKFRRQHPVPNTSFVVDFFTYENNIAIELDGGIHDQQQQDDQWRQQALEDAGYTVIRFQNDAIYNDLETVLTQILQAVKVPLPVRNERSGEGFRVRAVPAPPTDLLYRNIEDDPLDPRWTDIRAYTDYLAHRYDFFHWHIAFPEVFEVKEEALTPSPSPSGRGEQDTPTIPEITGWEGGFDVVLGNPPWERIKLQEKEWFAERVPEIASAPNASARKTMIKQLKQDSPQVYAAFLDDRRKAEGESHFIRYSQHYPLCGRGDVNTYTIFAESSRQLMSEQGRAGIIVPSGIATDATTQYFFNDLMQMRSLHSFYDFENRQGIFPAVDSRMKFCLMTMQSPHSLRPSLPHGERGANRGEVPLPVRDERSGEGFRVRAKGTQFVFFAHSVADLDDDHKRFTLTAEEIAMLNPNTGTMATFRNQRDAEITKQIYYRVPVLIDEGENINQWGIRFSTMFHMSNDSDKFRTYEELTAQGYTLDGNHFVKPSPPRHEGEGDLGGEGISRYLPLYEAKMMHQFTHRWATYDTDGKTRDMTIDEMRNPDSVVMPRYWMDIKEVETKTEDWTHDWLFTSRDICRSTDARTAIASILPKNATSGVYLIKPSNGINIILGFVANFSVFVFDFSSRQKIAGTHLSLNYLRQLPVIPPHTYTQALLDFIVPRVLELTYTAWDLQAFAQDVGYEGAPFVWDDERRFWLRAELDALYFHLYGIGREDVDYIMETFPIVKRKDIAATAGSPHPLNPPLPHGEGDLSGADEDAETAGYYRTKLAILEIYDEMATLPTMDVPAPKQPSHQTPLPRFAGLTQQGEGLTTISVPDVSQYVSKLSPPPADSSVAHEV